MYRRNDGAQAREDIEKQSIAHFERIESPLDHRNAQAQTFVALMQFEQASDTLILIFRQNSDHVRMPEAASIVMFGGKRERESDGAIAVETAIHVSTGMQRNDENRGRHHVFVPESPHAPLQVDAQLQVGMGMAGPDGQLGHSGQGFRSRFSRCLIHGHRDTIASRSAVPRPLRAAV